MDGAENKPCSGDNGAYEDNGGPSTEGTTDLEQHSIACEDCGLAFACWEVFKTHLQQHAVEADEKEAQTGDNWEPAAELVSEENGDEDPDGDGFDVSHSMQTKPSALTQGDGVASTSMQLKLQKVYACLVCGKLYRYLVSFRKHQQLHENPSSTAKSVSSLCKYECPECGMSFVRRTRLLSHLRVHRLHKPLRPKIPRCDQCNKGFTSVKSWIAHIDLHKEKPFWCLVCAKGFRDEESLDKHLQGHSLRQHKCDICQKRFQTSAHLMNHYTTHSRAKPYQCSYCGRSFSQARNLISHRNTHLKAFAGFNRTSVGIVNSAIMAKKRAIQKRFFLTSVEEEPKMDTQMQEQPGKEEGVEKRESPKPCEDTEFEDHPNSNNSDCGEPMHDCTPDESDTRQELVESKLQERNVHRQHKYWEWECCECDMGFDDMAKLHLHYIKHATGELPFPQSVTEG